MSGARTKVILDTDAGIDDAAAIFMVLEAHRKREVQLVAITTVHGNTARENVDVNVLRCLDTADLLEEIPVYGGAVYPLVREPEVRNHYHGHDGFGDVSPPMPTPSTELINRTHAACFLVQTAKEEQGKVVYVALGPLTNAALALSLDPNFIENLKDFYCMGGNVSGEGNIVPAAEFNFYMDPEAAFIVLERTRRPIKIVPLETCYGSPLTYEEREELSSTGSPIARLLNSIEHNWLKENTSDMWNTYDQLVTAWMLSEHSSHGQKHRLAQEMKDCFTTVELNGRETRGQMVLDRKKKKGKNPNIIYLAKIDTGIYKKYLSISFGGHFEYQEKNFLSDMSYVTQQ